MNLSYLETFITVARLQSFSLAAKALNLTQPAVSKHIALLENHYGIKLIDRSSRRVELTEAGETLLRYAQQVVDTLQAAEAKLHSFAIGVRGKLVIGASTIPGHYVMPGLISTYQRRYPHVKTYLEVSGTGHIVARLLEGAISIGAVGAPVEHPHIASQPFAVDEIVLIAPPQYRLAQKTSLEPSDLVGERIVWREKTSGTRQVVETKLAEAGINPRDLQNAGEFGSTEAVVAAVSAGAGMSFVSRYAAERAARDGRVQIVPLENVSLERPLYLIYPRERLLSPPAQAFLNFVQSR
ncbi:MAG: LysR family transcriptional regulator [Peptococcaceae bacterium]|nr:LysR family transcriptional regulator [Peptococcaceae bacterium]